MLQPQPINDRKFSGLEYDCLWWIIDGKKGIYAAIGDSGNVIYVNEDKSVVISVTSYFKPAVSDRIDFIQEKGEPFVLNR